MRNWWPFKRKDTTQDDLREAARLVKVRDSQLALLSAATSTADIAQDVTLALKEKLDDSVRQLESTAELICDALIICHSDGLIDSFNSAAERIFGWKSKDVVGRNVNSLFRRISGGEVTIDEIWNLFNEAHEEFTELDDPIEYLRGKRRSGELFWVDGNITRLERTDGTSIIMLLVRDVTNRVEEQRQTKLNEMRYRSIFEQSFDGIFVVNNYYVVAANPAISRVLGYTPEEMVAKPVTDLIHKDFQKLVTCNHEACMRGDTTPMNYVVKAVRKDGTVVELLVSSTWMKWEDSNASLITLKDVTEIRALEQTRRAHQRLVNNDIDMHITFDADCKILKANTAFLKYHGLTADEVMFTDAFAFAPSEYHEGYLKALQAISYHNPTGRLQSTVIIRNGERHVQDWIVHAIFDEEGEFIEYQAIGRDITEIINALHCSSCPNV